MAEHVQVEPTISSLNDRQFKRLLDDVRGDNSSRWVFLRKVNDVKLKFLEKQGSWSYINLTLPEHKAYHFGNGVFPVAFCNLFCLFSFPLNLFVASNSRAFLFRRINGCVCWFLYKVEFFFFDGFVTRFYNHVPCSEIVHYSRCCRFSLSVTLSNKSNLFLQGAVFSPSQSKDTSCYRCCVFDTFKKRKLTAVYLNIGIQ